MLFVVFIISLVATFISMCVTIFFSATWQSAINNLEEKIPASEGFGIYMVYYHPRKAIQIAMCYDVEGAMLLKKSILNGYVSGVCMFIFLTISMVLYVGLG